MNQDADENYQLYLQNQQNMVRSSIPDLQGSPTALQKHAIKEIQMEKPNKF